MDRDVRERYEEYCREFEAGNLRFISPMASQEYKDKIEDIEFDYSNTFAEIKLDGHRGTIHLGEKARVFSRNISKKTHWFTESTDNVPHISGMEIGEHRGTILDGEFDYGTTSMGVQSVMGSLPERAIKYQKEHGNINFVAFDILFFKGVDVRRLPQYKRKVLLAKAVYDLHQINDEEFRRRLYLSRMYYVDDIIVRKMNIYAIDRNLRKEAMYFFGENVPTYRKAIAPIPNYPYMMKTALVEGLEGIMIKEMSGIYESKRSKAYIKFKGESTWDCIVIGTKPSTREYTGKELDKWEYWEDGNGEKFILSEKMADDPEFELDDTCEPITKPYYYDWIGAIRFGVIDDEEEIVVVKGEEGKYPQIANIVDGYRYVGVYEDEYTVKYMKVRLIGDCKGITEELSMKFKEWEDGERYLGRVIEVKANGVINKETGTLRHPRYLKFRDDKNLEQCTMDNHIRVNLE